MEKSRPASPLLLVLSFGLVACWSVSPEMEELNELADRVAELEKAGSGTRQAPALSEEEQTAPEAAPEEDLDAARTTYSLGFFTVNLNGDGGGRSVQMELDLEVRLELADALADRKAALRHTVIQLVSDYSYKEIEGLDGKLRLQDDLLTHLQKVMGDEGRIERVYFTRFVVDGSPAPETEAEEEPAQGPAKPAVPPRDIVGQWVWKHAHANLSTDLTLHKVGEVYWMDSHHSDGSSSTARLVRKKSGSKTRLSDPEGNPGEYYLLSSSGVLEICDEMGCFMRMAKR